MAISKNAMTDQQALHEEADRLYELYGKPLEAEHWGELVAINPDGRVLLGDNAHDVMVKAAEAFGPGNFVFRIGPRTVGHFRGRLRRA